MAQSPRAKKQKGTFPNQAVSGDNLLYFAINRWTKDVQNKLAENKVFPIIFRMITPELYDLGPRKKKGECGKPTKPLSDRKPEFVNLENFRNAISKVLNWLESPQKSLDTTTSISKKVPKLAASKGISKKAAPKNK